MACGPASPAMTASSGAGVQPAARTSSCWVKCLGVTARPSGSRPTSATRWYSRIAPWMASPPPAVDVGVRRRRGTGGGTSARRVVEERSGCRPAWASAGPSMAPCRRPPRRHGRSRRRGGHAGRWRWQRPRRGRPAPRRSGGRWRRGPRREHRSARGGAGARQDAAPRGRVPQTSRERRRSSIPCPAGPAVRGDLPRPCRTPQHGRVQERSHRRHAAPRRERRRCRLGTARIAAGRRRAGRAPRRDPRDPATSARRAHAAARPPRRHARRRTHLAPPHPSPDRPVHHGRPTP